MLGPVSRHEMATGRTGYKIPADQLHIWLF
jgi:hypothetical protein